MISHCNKQPVFVKANLVPGAFSSFKIVGGETSGQGCESDSKSLLEFRHANTMKYLRFV